MKIISVVGARPNFVKIAPFVRAIEQYNANGAEEQIEHLLLHTGQHYDQNMSHSFFETLNIPRPDINFGIGSGTHAEQIGRTMMAFEVVLRRHRPDWVVVVGDVNATIACSLVAKKENVKCCHIEAGLRSGDLSMPEEINRIVTDRLADLLLTPDRISSENLLREGVSNEKIHMVGNIMIDSLEENRLAAQKLSVQEILERNLMFSNGGDFQSNGQDFALLTLHRPSNVDHQDILKPLIQLFLDEIAQDITILWPVHPRTRKQLVTFQLWDTVSSHPKIKLLHPMNYLELLRLNMEARMAFTDSGGLQEECTILGTPCLTLRWNTERPVTLMENGGGNILVGNSVEKIRNGYYALKERSRKPVRPLLWDGKTAQRCLQAILEFKVT